ncbi:(2Fe-2S) ferredoxin domain-containing protein [Legionella parisiensis]|uniref:Ferredoxin, 2Fe-2S n=1 Tax=Legionella parisiensis TaxID=45071 RepID=A0A1E5JR70_9GAMM|nr:(2Fe-2S) ferredoxin domain-containing protein [Legionella parisiensis]KTD44174.1 (2Fe-2S) ferredoxin [Legionella parisiensis]OEH47031.1 Ferredoxin, 2Fe-2S [Legionella parisiensis]STX71798.1 (2Fe-2S) ferredoxin [Legionella parisiensis]
MAYYNKHVLICTNQKAAGKQCCADSGGETYFDYMKSRLLELEIHGPGKVRVSKSGCLGRCSSGPCIVIYPEGVWYSYSSFADIDKIIERHLVSGSVVEQLLIDQE